MKIMVGYDGSKESKAALSVAIKYAHAFDAEVYLVASVEKGAEDEAKTIHKLEDELKNGEKELANAHIPHKKQLLLRGMRPDEDLVAYAKEQGIDEIVIGIRMRSKVSKLFFGSTAQYLVLNAHCPVITVK